VEKFFEELLSGKVPALVATSAQPEIDLLPTCGD
jgi:hypothetical protein